MSDHPLISAALEVGVPRYDLPSTVDPTRFVDLDGALNARDVGGLRNKDGESIRRNTLLRTDHLNDITDAGLARMTSLGLRYVYDFRLPVERERQPSRLPEGVKVELLATGDLSVAEAMVAKIPAMLTGEEPIAAADWWDANYIDMLQRAHPMFSQLVMSLTDPLDSLAVPQGSSPVSALYHCTGGKDRTGMATALILDVLGVDHELIVDDFLTTNVQRTPKRLPFWQPQFLAAGITTAQALPILGVTRSGIETALGYIAEQGGAEAYLKEAGVPAERFEALRATLLVA